MLPVQVKGILVYYVEGEETAVTLVDMHDNRKTDFFETNEQAIAYAVKIRDQHYLNTAIQVFDKKERKHII